MAAGDLTRQIPVSGQDELARLTEVFNDGGQTARQLRQPGPGITGAVLPWWPKKCTS
ncbi:MULTISPECIES: HAMP domain-containing protein [Desulfofundulus]|jgi:methyl-accepting chemotaxis protein|uniref:HAMP domain-containing protein n=1 Tax=Desulfofundulus sp. TPOSR TaxID=2714340 RepID=UPI0002FB643C